MIEKVLTAELGGKGAIEYRSSGIIFQVIAPLPDQDKTGASPDDQVLFRRNISTQLKEEH